jgi:N-acetylneuraminate lyase
MKKIHGIVPALITPYGNDGKILESSLEALIEKTIGEGVHGFYVGGSTAEAFLLSDAERKLLIDTVTSHVNGRRFVISHVGSISTDTACDLARHAERAGADAVSAIPPFYYNFSAEEIMSHYLEIADSTNLPVILYNFPGFSGVTIDRQTMPRLFEDPRIIGIKHTSLDLHQLERIRATTPSFVTLNGHDEVFLPALALGVDGAVGSTYNVMGSLFVRIFDLFRDGKMDEARTLQVQANNVIDVLVEVGVFSGIKYLLEGQGIPAGACRKPFQPLDDRGRALLDTVQPLLVPGL